MADIEFDHVPASYRRLDPLPELDADQLLRQLKGRGAMLRPRQPKKSQ
jgi:hypothetical protein